MATNAPRAFARPTKRQLIAIGLAVAVAAGVGSTVRPAHAAEAPVDLGTASSYGVLGGQEVTSTGPSRIGGDVGVHPGSATPGLLPGQVGGVIHLGDAQALQAQSDLTTAYDDAALRTPIRSGLAELGGESLLPGVYSGGALEISGDLTLIGDADSVFIFQAASSLITASGTSVLLSGAVNPCNVFWQIGTTATLGSNSTMVGTVMALTSINAQTGATVNGRLLARNAAVTLDNNEIAGPLSCTTTTSAPPAAPAPPAVPVPGDATFVG